MRLIDADSLKDTVEYCLLQHEDTEKWVEWFNQVIDAEETIMELTSNTDDAVVGYFIEKIGEKICGKER